MTSIASMLSAVVLSVLLVVVSARTYHDAVVVEARSDPGENLERVTKVHPEDCLLPSSTGPCRGFFENFYFNSKSGKCEAFVWSGCGGNRNRFQTESECERVCGGKKSSSLKEDKRQTTTCDGAPVSCGKGCKLIKDAENCLKCECMAVRTESKDVCALPAAVRGNCRALLPRWSFHPKQGKCMEFKFGGCDGNGNNFRSKEECMKTCGGA